MTATPQTPQLREGFEKPIGEWGLGCLDSAVTVGDGRFGDQGAHLTYSNGPTRARWCTSQITAAPECAKFLLGVWIRHTVVPAWYDTTSPNIIAVDDSLGSDLVDVRMLPSDGGMALWSLGDTDALTDPVADDWEFWELRGVLGDTGWLFEVRRSGVLAASIQSAYTDPIRVTGAGVGDSIVGSIDNVVEFDTDRMWWWAGTVTDLDPEWWSATPGLDGEDVPLTVYSASVTAEFTARLGDLFSAFEGDAVQELIAGEANEVRIRVEASVDLDAQTVDVGIALRGSNPLNFYTAAWTGALASTRVATIDTGPGELYDPTPNVYEVWVKIDGGPPFKVAGEIVFT